MDFFLLHLIGDSRVTLTQNLLVSVTLDIYLFENVHILHKHLPAGSTVFFVFFKIGALQHDSLEFQKKTNDKRRSGPSVVTFGKIVRKLQHCINVGTSPKKQKQKQKPCEMEN